jgi:lipoate-protein ligase A
MGIWRLIETFHAPAVQHGRGSVLLESYAQNSHPVFRIYEWAGATLSLGRNEKLDNRLDLDVCESFGIPLSVVQQVGKAVLHGFDLTYSLVGGVLDKHLTEVYWTTTVFSPKGFYAFF